MKHRSWPRAITAGLIATLTMGFLGLFANQLGAPFLDWARALSQYVGGNSWVGYLMFFCGGLTMAMIYVIFLHDRLPGHSWERGLFFAVLIWIATGAVAAPLMNLGFFMESVMMALGTLFIYLVYGAVLGFIYDG